MFRDLNTFLILFRYHFILILASTLKLINMVNFVSELNFSLAQEARFYYVHIIFYSSHGILVGLFVVYIIIKYIIMEMFA